jgi:hypothetical protein
VGGVVAVNLVGFPEAGIVEGGAGVADLFLIFTDTRGADAVAVVAANTGGYGAVAGGTVGAALSSNGCK